MQNPLSANLIDQTLFDLLVDGELPDDRRRDLLAQLDIEPHGWKRCALAFLEAQAWRSEVRRAPWSGIPVAAPNVSHVSTVPLPRQRNLAGLIIVASLLSAVGFGLGRWSVDRQPEHISLATREKLPASEKQRPPVIDEKPGADASPGHTKPAPAADRDESVKVAGVLAWSVDENGQTREMSVPVLEGAGIDLKWLLSQPAAIREPVRKELERRGHKVELHRQLITLSLKDGRSVVMPIDQVDVRFAGRVYQ